MVTPDRHLCDHGWTVRLLTEGDARGVTHWVHGAGGEAVMVVTPEMRKAWDAAGEASVDHLIAWLNRVHEYETERVL